jgi:hypothetical protein
MSSNSSSADGVTRLTQSITNEEPEESCGNGGTDSSSSGNTGDTPQTVDQSRNCYIYPYDFYDVKTGNIPTEEEALRQRWGYRQIRQNGGNSNIDEVPFHAQTIVREMNNLRDSLRLFARLAYMEYIRPLLIKYGFERPADGQHCVSLEDVVTMIKTAPTVRPNKSDELFEIFHYKSSDWTSNIVDAWARQNKIVIKFPNKVASMKRQPNKEFYRGGFGPIVNTSRMFWLKRIMLNMFKGLGWKIAISMNEKNSKTCDYTTKYWKDDKKQKYYVVEERDPGQEEPGLEVCFIMEVFYICPYFETHLCYHTL